MTLTGLLGGDIVYAMRNVSTAVLLAMIWPWPCLGQKAAAAAPDPAVVAGTVSGSEPSRPASGNALMAGIEWVTIPSGSFMMGADDWSDRQPRHQVAIKTFQMAKTLVTNKQYLACVQAGACTAPEEGGIRFGSNGDDQPAIDVDWNQARNFCKWAGGRLPSEAEWEYAARSEGKEQKYPWGDEEATCARAVISEDGCSHLGSVGCGCGRNATWAVCSRPAGNTEQGLCDMAGNVWEWVQDWYHDSYDGAPADGSAWESPAGSLRVFRGGSWYLSGQLARSANRGRSLPGYSGRALGFRPVRDLRDKPAR